MESKLSKFTFLAYQEITLENFRQKLGSFGLAMKSASSAADWVRWTRPSGDRVILAASTHHGHKAYWTTVGFDSLEFSRQRAIQERRLLIDDFSALGKNLWGAFEFYDGILAPEEEGPMFSSLQKDIQGVKSARSGIRGSNYATFLSREANELMLVEEWVPEEYPHASINRIAREGVLVFWDDSKEGLGQYLTEEFRIS